MNIKNKVILVTGGTSGIGEACSRHFASLGARVVIVSNQEERGSGLEKELRAAAMDARGGQLESVFENTAILLCRFVISSLSLLPCC